MEPITAGWMITTLLSGVIGGRGDFLLCKGFDKLRKRITENVNEPANHHIQKGIRKSYLNATLLAVEHIQKQRKKYSLSDRRWNNLEDIKVYIKNRINQAEDEESYVRGSNLDGEYRDILFPKKGVTSKERKPELIQKLKDSIIKEFEANRLLVENELKSCIYNGWLEGKKDMDFYKLTCAFFTQELKDDPQLSTYIQTEYLDQIKKDLGEVSLKVDDLKDIMRSYYEIYKDILSKVDEILDTVKSMNVKLDKIPEKTAELIFEGIENKLISRREITVSDTYQEKLKTLVELEEEMKRLRSQIEGLKKAIKQVEKQIKPSLEQNLSSLESQLIEKGNVKDNKEKQLNEFVSNVISLAKQLQTTVDMDSYRLKKARQLFAISKFDEVNNVLNENDIDADIERYRKLEEKSKEKLKELTHELTIKAQTIVLNKPKDWFEEADRLYAKAMSVYEDFNTVFNYAYFLHVHRQISKAVKIYEKAFYYILNKEEKALVLNNLANLQSDRNEYDKAEASYQEALEIYKELAKANPQTYLSDVAMTLNNLAVLQSDRNEYDKAEASYQEALEIRRQLAKANPQTYLSDVAATLNNLVVLQRARNEYDKAEASCQEALEIRRQLAKANPQTYLSDVAATLNNLAILQRDRNEYDKAEASYEEALEIRRQLAKANPQTYLSDVAMTLNNLANLQSDRNEYDKAEASYEEALEIRRQLAKANPQTYLSDVAATLNNLAILQRDRNEYDKAEASYQEALEIYKELASANPQTYLSDVAMTLNNLAVLQCNRNEYDKAEASYQEALEIRRQLVKENPNVYLISFGDTSISLAIFYKNYKINKQKSIRYAEIAQESYKAFVPKIPHAVKWSKKTKEILEYWEKN